MPFLRSLAVFVCSCLVFGAAEHEITRHIRRVTQTLPDLGTTMHPWDVLQGHTHSRSYRRSLLTLTPACTWSEAMNTCDVSKESTAALLIKADNPVAKFLERGISCYNFDEEECEKNGCQWYSNDLCSYTFEDYQTMMSTSCVKNAKALVDMVVWRLECADIESEFPCNVHDHCYWNKNHNLCVFDRWTYFFDIETNDGLPSGFYDMQDLREDQLSKFFSKVYNATDKKDKFRADNILFSTPPKFRCPVGGQKLLCDYTEAVSSYLQPLYYCNFKYSAGNACDEDVVCTTTKADKDKAVCTVNEKEIMKSVYKGEAVFVDAIEDEDAKKLARKTLHCMRQTTRYACNGDCHWSDTKQACYLKGKWIANQVDQLLGSSNDPVCEYVRLDSSTGCIDRENEIDCSYDGKCYWSVNQQSCSAGLEYKIVSALESSHIACEYRDLKSACTDVGNRRLCNAVPKYDSSKSMGHSHGTKKKSTSLHPSQPKSKAVVATNSIEAEEKTSTSAGAVKGTSSNQHSNIVWLALFAVTVLVVAGIVVGLNWRQLKSLVSGRSITAYTQVDMEEITH